MKSIEERVIQVLSEAMTRSVEKINLETELFTAEGLNADDLDKVEIVMELEDEFNLSIPDENVSEWVKVKDIVNYINSL